METGIIVLQKHRSLMSLRIQVEMHSRAASGALGKPSTREVAVQYRGILRARWQNSVKRYRIKVMAWSVITS